MERTIFLGDIHGCAAELDLLLEHVRPGAADRLVCVGDILARGPDSRRVLRTLQRLGARAVLGNHELRLLAARRARKEGRPLPKLESTHRELLESLAEDEWRFIAAMPLEIELREHGVRVVHAGVVPGWPFERHDPRLLTHLRTIRADGTPSERLDGTLWGELYHEGPHVVFGHNAISGLQIHPQATGLDTACVYGGRLTALVLDAGARVPTDAEARRACLVSVDAVKAHFSIESLKR